MQELNIKTKFAKKGNEFVGIRFDEKNGPCVCFPIGYHIEKTINEKELKKDIRSLLNVLYVFGSSDSDIERFVRFNDTNLEFPLQAYFDIIDYFLKSNGRYYIEMEKMFLVDFKGKINWKKTIQTQKALIADNGPIYTDFVVQRQSPLHEQLITQIHKFCTYEAFQKVGWLFTDQQVEKPTISLNDENKKVFLQELQRKYNETNVVRYKMLFRSMKAMIEFLNNKDARFSLSQYGTCNFEHIWEKIIDKFFGISDKDNYFPKATWTTKYSGKIQSTHSLMPDSVMVCGDETFMLDSKYYSFGISGLLADLPGTSDISKQITYGEYAKTSYEKVENKTMANDPKKLFNAFLMPFDAADKEKDWQLLIKNSKDERTAFLANVVEARGDWRGNELEYYERIQGVLIDTKYILSNYRKNHDSDKESLAGVIKDGLLSGE